jgi:MFS family permease
MTPSVSNRAAVNATAFAQGAALVIYAAYNHILISKYNYHLTAMEYGLAFAPEIVALIAPAVLAARIGRRWPTRRVYPAGLACSLVSMVLLIVSASVGARADFPVLLVSSIFLGAGFGLTMLAVIAYAQMLSPARPERSVLVVSALLAAGVAVPPLLTLAYVPAHFWPGGPAVLALVFTVLLIASRRLPATGAADAATLPLDPRVPRRVKLYGILVLVYAVSVIMCVAWSQASAVSRVPSPLTFGALELGAFWAALVMLARVLFTALDAWPTGPQISLALFALAAAVAVISLLAHAYPLARIGIYVLAALACAALVPLDHRVGRHELTMFSVAFAAAIAVLYPLGLGLAKASLTTVRHADLSLPMVFGITSAIGFLASVLLLRVLPDRPGKAAAASQ